MVLAEDAARTLDQAAQLLDDTMRNANRGILCCGVYRTPNEAREHNNRRA